MTREKKAADGGGGGVVLALRPAAAAEALSISERLLHTLTAAGRIKCRRIGKCKLYTVAELERFLLESEAEGGDPR